MKMIVMYILCWFCFLYRNTSRAIIIEFKLLNKIYKGVRKVELFRAVREVQAAASSAVGELIHLARNIFLQKVSKTWMKP